MNRTLSIYLALTALLLCTPLRAQHEIAVLMSNDSTPYQMALEGFQAHLRDSGIQAGYEVLNAGGNKDKATQLAGKLHDRIDERPASLVFCIGSLACGPAQKLAAHTPVVASLVLKATSISSAAQATGVYLSYLPQTQLQWLKKLFPSYHRVGVIYNPEHNQDQIDAARKTASQLGLELVAVSIESPRELPTALKDLLRKIDILWALPDKVVLSPQTAKEVLLASFRNRIPVIGASASWVKSGALYALDWDYRDIGAQNAVMALKIINGTPISNIPPVEPRLTAYILNLKTAEHMQLTIPEEIIRGAKHVYR